MSSDDRLDTHVWRRLKPYLDRANQQQLATRVGLTQPRISAYKRRQWQRPPLDVLDDLARAFGLSLAQILEEKIDSRPAWQQELYAALAGMDEDTAGHVLWLTRRASAAGTASAPLPRDDPRPIAAGTRARTRKTTT